MPLKRGRSEKKKSLKYRKKLRQKSRKGAGALFISRNQALRKLQLSLKEFRKLCILKGVYPQEPKKKFRTQNKIFYFTKDIRFLLHDPLIPIFRSFKVWRAKISRAKARKEYDRVEVLRTTRPKYRLDHLIRERYPTFPDALRDLDDCLSLVCLFASLPQSKMLKAKRIALCAQLYREFQYYMILTRSLKKAFISLKGYYFQGVVMGQTVTWLVPHNFTPKVPSDVDINIMLTFLELYETLLGFVNFRLFQSIGLRYPPVIDYSKLKENEFYASLRFERENTDEIDEAESATHEEMKEVFTEYTDVIQATAQKTNADFKNLFSGLRFFVSREVPREALEFVIRCFGGSVSYEGGPYPESDETITHQITDRPLTNKSFTREYVQPQWVFDSVNNQLLMPTYEYAVNAKLPPHLSPFVNDENVGYIPERRQKINEMISLARGIIPKKNDKKGDQEEEEVEDDSEDELEAAKLLESRYAKEYEKEASGQSYSKETLAEDEKAVDQFIKNKLMKQQRLKRLHHHYREIMITSHRKRNTYMTSVIRKKRRLSKLKEIKAKRAKIDSENSDAQMSTTD